ncbi:type II toxin-antitoxin system VapC family toxin [Myxococcota bacterium]|jgi:predicted nucleic acid-binding protein|nr:type II toxin-antitoxin system VapC family toxin [Myxococcota bacterium]
MSAVLVDSNVLLDVATNDPVWGPRSAAALAAFAERSVLVVNPIIYAEVSIGFDRIEDVEAALPADIFRREALPFEASFLAGKAFRAYRRRGGDKRSPLPDFFIGAHAAVAGHNVLTRDAARYRTYFPKVGVVEP